MQTFGKRQYDHVQLDPWAKKTQRPETSDAPRAAISRPMGLAIAFAAIGVIALASVQMLALA